MPLSAFAGGDDQNRRVCDSKLKAKFFIGVSGFGFRKADTVNKVNYMKKMKLIALFLIPLSVMALTVDEEEVKKVEPVEFEDYEGPNKTRSSHNQIVQIGKDLKKYLKKEKYTFMGKYTMVHAVDPASEKLNADIFIIEKKAKVDTIYNIRRILSGYLQEAYGYSYRDAFTLAKFITYYNAVYRSDMDYFNGKYSDKVLSYLSDKNAGIAISYKEWPGKSRVLIPLRKDKAGLDTTNITDENVITSLREEEDRGVDDRKEIVDIKKEDLKEDKEDLKEKKEEVEKKEEEIVKKEEEIEKRKEEVKKIEDPVRRETEEKKIEKEEQQITKEKEQVETQKEEIQKEEERIVEKQEEIQKDEQEIQKDERLNELAQDPEKAVEELEKTQEELEETKEELQETKEELVKEKENIMEGKFYYLKVNEWEEEGHYNNDMMIIDPATRKVIVRSPVKRIDCDKYLLNEKGVVVIIHNDDKPSEHNLVLLDKEKLTLVKKGADNVFWRSFIEDRDGFIYVIVSKSDGYYLGRFTYDLELETISDVKLDRDSFISFFGESIYINRSDKTIVVLNKKDLSFVAEIAP